MKKIKEIFSEYSVFIIIAIAAIFYLQQCNSNSNLKSKLDIMNQNQRALNDSIETYKGKDGIDVKTKAIFIANQRELKELNKELYDELKKLKGDIKSINKVVSNISYNTYETNNSVSYGANGYRKIDWDFDTIYSVNNSKHIKGYSDFTVDSLGNINKLKTYITKDSTSFDIITGLEKDKKTYKIFVKSNYPGFNASKIEGAVLDKKLFNNESSVVIGPQLGIGIGSNLQPTIYIGVGVTYNVNKSFKKLFR